MKKTNKKGFTLVELVIVVAVMAILVAVAIPTISSISNSAQESVDKSNARTVESIIKLAEAEADGATLQASAIDTALTEAKLGIEKGTFLYDSAKGTVTPCASTVTLTTGQFKIEFDKDATAGTGEGAAADNTIKVTAFS